MKTFQLNEDFRIELFASEPDVADPVEIAFDEAGRVYVAEMADYPDDPSPGKTPRSRIRLLEDTDGDGRVDRSTVFADKLLQVTSVLPWKGGVIVTSAPDILYLKDTDGDGKADVRRVLFTGFALANSESRITNLRFGIDNWIYASNNGQPGNITFSERPDIAAVSVIGADFRFRLDRGLFEAESGPTQFGQAMDDWGHRFITENTIHVRSVVLPRRYLGRNLFLIPGAAAQDISDHGQPSARMFPLTQPQHWREVRTQMRQQRYRENKLDSVRPLNPSTEIAGGYITAAAGGTIYTGDTFPEKYRGNLFTGDVSGNLVHRDILHFNGVAFTASRPKEEQEREFLASTDAWFRPCNFAVGPDGNLYIVDMYREFIETPESIPEELKKEMNFYSGDTMGRIYRIVPKRASLSSNPKPNLGNASTSALVRLLSHPNGWWRLTAQRLLLERQDKSAIPLLKKLVSEPDSAQARLHALYALEGMSSLESSLIEIGLRDAQTGVREHAVRLAEGFPELTGRLAGMVEDPSPHVRLQLALSLGEFVATDGVNEEIILKALSRLASVHAEDPWFRSALLSSIPRSPNRLLQSIISDSRFFRDPTKGKEQFLHELALVIGAKHEVEEIARFMNVMATAKALGDQAWQGAGLSGLARGLKMAGVSRLKVPNAESVLRRSLVHPSEKVQTAARDVARYLELRTLISGASKEVFNRSLPSSRREQAIMSLASGAFSDVRPVFEQLLSSQSETALWKAAIQALALLNDSEVSGLLIARWKSFGPELRNQVIDVLLNHRARVVSLLQAIEEGRIERAALDLPRKEKLLGNPDADISGRAKKIFGEHPSDRSQVIQAYRSALGETGDAVRGKTVFETNCAACHMPRRGRRIGPDLSGVSSRSKAQLLEDILNPSKSIQSRFTNYIVVTKDGKIRDGLVVGETPGTLTIRPSEGEDETLLRSNISEIRASSVSLMPDGLEQSMSKADVADLIAYLQGANLQRP